MTQSIWQTPDRLPDLTCDVAIIGGGILGTSTAYWLHTMKPQLRIAIVEAHTLGWGASGRNAGFLLQGTDANYAMDVERFGPEVAELLWTFTLENRQRIGEACDPDVIALKASGNVIAAGSIRERDQLIESAELLTQRGVGVTYWTGEQVKEHVGGRFEGALYVQDGASIHPLKLVQTLAQSSQAVVLEHHPVTDITASGTVCQIHTPLRTITTGRVCVTANAYLPRLLPETTPLLYPVRAQMLAMTAPNRPLPFPCYSHDGYYYIRQSPSGALLVGGARHLFREEEVGYEDQTTPHLQQALIDYVTTHFPDHGPTPVESRWSGTMALTADGLPLYSPIEHLPGSYWAAGFNGHGMGYGFRFGQMMAEVMTDSPGGDAYKDLFHVRRLEESQSA